MNKSKIDYLIETNAATNIINIVVNTTFNILEKLDSPDKKMKMTYVYAKVRRPVSYKIIN